MTESEATRFAEDWIGAWNSHDLDRILAHYAEDVELTSPLASRILGNDQDTVRGKAALRAYFKRALETYPDLEFTLWGVYAGAMSVVVHYQSVRGLRAAELMRLNPEGRVAQVVAHYASPATAESGHVSPT